MIFILSFSAVPAGKISASSQDMMMTIVLRHDQSMTLDEISEHLRATGFWESFPPQGVEVVSWNIVMGLGHVIVLRFAPERLREVNLNLEKTAWGAFTTEFYPTYDYKAIWTERKKTAAAG